MAVIYIELEELAEFRRDARQTNAQLNRFPHATTDSHSLSHFVQADTHFSPW